MNKSERKKELRNKGISELNAELSKIYQDLQQLILSKSIKKEKNTRVIKAKRKEIAVIKTLLRELELKTS